MPTKPDTDQSRAAKERITAAAQARDKAIADAHRAFWQTVDAEIKAKHITQTAVADHLDFSREHIRQQIKKHTT